MRCELLLQECFPQPWKKLCIEFKLTNERFLWVKLYMQRICRETVEDDVLSALRDRLPESIDQLYQSSLDCISRAGNKARDLAMKVLSWVLHMREPLTPPVLLAALESGQDPALDAAQLMNIWYNLVLLDTQCNVVRFSHQSVQDFLRGHESFPSRTAIISWLLSASRLALVDQSQRTPRQYQATTFTSTPQFTGLFIPRWPRTYVQADHRPTTQVSHKT